MRIRSIRPEFWSSEDVAALPWDARLVFIGLWSYVDDNGVGRDVEQLIVAALFPLDEDLTEASVRVHGALKLLEDGGQITRYTVDGKPYLHVTAFSANQVVNRPSKPRYPAPTSGDAEPSPPLTEDSLSPQRTPATGEGEKGRRGEGKNTSGGADESKPTFAEFYAAYPKKEARRAAEKAWNAAVKRASPETIMEGLRRHRFKADRQFVPHPATWLNQDRWADGQAEPVAPGQEPPARTFTRGELNDLLGEDSWQVPAPPPEWDPDDPADQLRYRDWCRDKQAEHHAERTRQALAVLARQ
jgi:hypothetical protein